MDEVRQLSNFTKLYYVIIVVTLIIHVGFSVDYYTRDIVIQEKGVIALQDIASTLRRIEIIFKNAVNDTSPIPPPPSITFFNYKQHF